MITKKNIIWKDYFAHKAELKAYLKLFSKKRNTSPSPLSMQQIFDECGIKENKKPVHELENISWRIDEILYGKDAV